MTPRSSLLCLTLMLTACASLPEVPVAKTDIVGSYYAGNGVGKTVGLDLRADGTYAGSWSGCMGNYGNAHGRWSATRSNSRR